jgi:hypothetical protein
MNIRTASRLVLVVAAGAVAFTAGTAAAKADRDRATRHCMALARMGMPMAARPSLGIKRRQTIAFNQCMEREGFGHGHGHEK